MPELTWVGKEKVITHHLDVPYRVLDRQYSFDETGQHEADNGSENMIIHGDNLEALKALLPKYEGKVDCVYIDPPYNTGNEGWVYNDAVNDPRIKKWLGEVVGKEGEDLSRHDKWLCMMYPRLRLLQRLLAPTGVIFISIDDNEVANLKLICDEIFGAINHVATFIWRSRQRADNRNASMVSTDHEYILCFSKVPGGFVAAGQQIDTSKYKNPDSDPRGPWASIDLSGLANSQQRPNLHYDITDPITGISYPPNPNRGWSKSKENVERMIDEGRVLFPKSPTGRPREKKFLSSLRTQKTGFSSVLTEKVGFTTNGTREMRKIFSRPMFDFPKSIDLVETLIAQATPNGGLVLDSFAGSGTTGHACLRASHIDRLPRHFILVELDDYAETVTAERIRRVISGYGNGSSRTRGINGSFSFYELGAPLLVEGNLNPEVPLGRVREYIWFTETSEAYRSDAAQVHPDFLGRSSSNTSYFFVFDPEAPTVLDRAFLSSIPIECAAEAYVIYADTCLLTEQELVKHNITFKKIPRDITRL
ncbi:site-specific DNA-methyltransferase [Dermabacter hominis]|uniref:site-specific DNA-methyltransferase n=1 Tax=Dermabacter hominis TaxID=36740 RepID=UPI000C7624C2|nr:site-specific DNA-methyltransferase [Dermabacter hominis]